MKLRNVKNNHNELEMDNKTILFSYATPVAVFIEGKGYFVRKEYIGFSATTSKHLAAFLPQPAKAFAKEYPEKGLTDTEFFALIA